METALLYLYIFIKHFEKKGENSAFLFSWFIYLFILHLLFSSYIISPLEKHSETHRLKIVVAIEVAFLICELYLVSGYLIQACVPQRYYRYE